MNKEDQKSYEFRNFSFMYANICQLFVYDLSSAALCLLYYVDAYKQQTSTNKLRAAIDMGQKTVLAQIAEITKRHFISNFF